MSLDKLKTVNKSVNCRKNWRRRANNSFGATRKKKLWSKKTKANADAVVTTKEGVPLVVVTSAPTYHSDDDDRSGVDGKHGSFEWLTQKFGTCCSTTTDENNNHSTTNSNDLKEWTAAQNKLENSSSVVVHETKADMGDRSEPDPPVGDIKEASSSSALGGGGGKGWEWILSCCCSPPQQQVVDRVVDDRTYECTNIESGECNRSSCDDDDEEGSDESSEESSQSSQHLAGQWVNLPTMADDISDISSSDTSDDEESDYESDDERQ
jgi:hypothetical protein